jgi:hypothetical protein
VGSTFFFTLPAAYVGRSMPAKGIPAVGLLRNIRGKRKIES